MRVETDLVELLNSFNNLTLEKDTGVDLNYLRSIYDSLNPNQQEYIDDILGRLEYIIEDYSSRIRSLEKQRTITGELTQGDE